MMCYTADRKDGRTGTACRNGGCTRSFFALKLFPGGGCCSIMVELKDNAFFRCAYPLGNDLQVYIVNSGYRFYSEITNWNFK